MPRVRHGGYVFQQWVGDHPPVHVHVLKDGKVVTKWDIRAGVPMPGYGWPPQRVVVMIRELVRTGRLRDA